MNTTQHIKLFLVVLDVLLLSFKLLIILNLSLSGVTAVNNFNDNLKR